MSDVSVELSSYIEFPPLQDPESSWREARPPAEDKKPRTGRASNRSPILSVRTAFREAPSRRTKRRGDGLQSHCNRANAAPVKNPLLGKVRKPAVWKRTP